MASLEPEYRSILKGDEKRTALFNPFFTVIFSEVLSTISNLKLNYMYKLKLVDEALNIKKKLAFQVVVLPSKQTQPCISALKAGLHQLEGESCCWPRQ
jgi:hypothetical protein